jgi:hypothetical protein
VSRYVWWARKSEDASPGNSQDPVLDDEVLESDEDDHHADDAIESEGVTNVPLPTTTDATQASVEQLSALAVSSKDDADDEAEIGKAPSKAKAPSSDKDTPTLSP